MFNKKQFVPGSRRYIVGLVAAILIPVFLSMCSVKKEVSGSSGPEQSGAIPMAVLGDSDSHIYRDPINGVKRGGEYHLVTFQWTEILDALRPEAFDLGAKGVWGTRTRYATLKDWFGGEGRTPSKYDFRYNYAISGLGCDSLLENWPRQGYWLIRHITRNKNHWDNGIVVFRIGINDIGQIQHHNVYARTGLTPEISRRVRTCVRQIADAVSAIQQANASTRIVLVGIADNSILPVTENESRSQEELNRIRSVLDLFDNGLSKLAEENSNVIFMDDRIWLESYWPAIKGTQPSGKSMGVTMTRGDFPRNLMLQDGHAGTVVNGFWARELIQALNNGFGLGIAPLQDTEIAALVDPEAKFGIAPKPGPQDAAKFPRARE